MKQENDKIYIVKYCGGSYEDYYEKIIFATTKKTCATKYVTRFNKILKKWKTYYKQFETVTGLGFSWLDNEFVEPHFNRWDSLRRINNCYWEEIPVR